jgi:hypothetical protein
MSRGSPIYQPPSIIARGWLSPNGAHTLEIAVPSGIVGFEIGADQVEYLERAIAAWKQHVMFADGGGEIRNRRPFPIEVAR